MQIINMILFLRKNDLFTKFFLNIKLKLRFNLNEKIEIIIILNFLNHFQKKI